MRSKLCIKILSRLGYFLETLGFQLSKIFLSRYASCVDVNSTTQYTHFLEANYCLKVHSAVASLLRYTPAEGTSSVMNTNFHINVSSLRVKSQHDHDHPDTTTTSAPLT